MGILLKYNTNVETNEKIKYHKKTKKFDYVNIGLIGAGSFAQNILLPKLKNECNMVGICTSKGNVSKYVGDIYNLIMAQAMLIIFL